MQGEPARGNGAPEGQRGCPADGRVGRQRGRLRAVSNPGGSSPNQNCPRHSLLSALAGLRRQRPKGAAAWAKAKAAAASARARSSLGNSESETGLLPHSEELAWKVAKKTARQDRAADAELRQVTLQRQHGQLQEPHEPVAPQAGSQMLQVPSSAAPQRRHTVNGEGRSLQCSRWAQQRHTVFGQL